MSVNIYDVAKLAGVSIATVSRVVNGNTNVSEKTRAKVMKVMEEYGYTPNVFARGLGLDSMKTVGILCPGIADLYVSDAVDFLVTRMNQYDYDCILGCSGYGLEGKKLHTKLLLSKRIDALIMVGSTYAGSAVNGWDVSYIQEAAKEVPVFIINGYVEGENIYCSYCDDFQATYDVTTKMIEQGRKKILFLYDSHSYSSLKKMSGYETALHDAGYPVCGNLKMFTKNRIHYVRDLLLSHTRLEFDAAMAAHDGLAIGVLKYAKERNLRVPEDICVVGYNNSSLSVSCDPELTTVDNHLEKICIDTVDYMLRVLQGETDVPKNNVVVASIKKRFTANL